MGYGLTICGINFFGVIGIGLVYGSTLGDGVSFSGELESCL